MNTLGRVLLVRHGDCVSLQRGDAELVVADDDNHLTDQGRQAAIVLGRHLRTQLGSARVLASPLARARDSALAIAKAFDATVEFDARLAERRFGFEPTTTQAQSRRLQVGAFQEPDLRHGTGETVREHRARVETWWHATAATIDHEALVVVSHGGTVDHLMAIAYGAPVESVASVFTRLDPCSYHAWTLLEPAPGLRVWRLDEVNARAAE